MIANYITTRTPKFGAGTRTLRAGRTQPDGLTDEQIRHTAPSIFAEAPHASRSARYTYIPTSEILTGLRREGFRPMEIRQAGSRIEGKAEFTKHLIRLRHASQFDLGNSGLKAGDSVPEIILINSHDGTSSYQLMSGLFRIVCTNGLIASDGTAGRQIRVPHTGDVTSQVIDGCIEILDAMPATLDAVRSFESLAITNGEQLAFARAAQQLRYPDSDTPPVTPEKLLETNRREDTGPDLWRTLNRVQENTVRGGQFFITRDAENRRRRGHTREVKGIDGNVSLNRALWTLAEEMRKLKA